jgi:hypothetical protein
MLARLEKCRLTHSTIHATPTAQHTVTLLALKELALEADRLVLERELNRLTEEAERAVA